MNILSLVKGFFISVFALLLSILPKNSLPVATPTPGEVKQVQQEIALPSATPAVTSQPKTPRVVPSPKPSPQVLSAQTTSVNPTPNSNTNNSSSSPPSQSQIAQPTVQPTPSYSYKPCCTSPSGEQINLEPSVDCLSYEFGGKSYDLGQIAQKIKDATGVKLMAESANSDNIVEVNGGMGGNSVGITVTLYKTDAYNYSNFRSDYPGWKVVYHYIPVACTDDLKQKFISTLDSYKATLP